MPSPSSFCCRMRCPSEQKRKAKNINTFEIGISKDDISTLLTNCAPLSMQLGTSMKARRNAPVRAAVEACR
eukprot:3735067-Pleurochrysis_carterae.AAC.1